MVIMMILWYVSVEDMILNGSSSFEIFWTTDYVDSKVRKVHANFPIQIGIFSNIFEKWQGKNFLKQGKNFHTSDKVKTSSNKVKRSQGKNFLKQGKNFHRIWQGIYRHRRMMITVRMITEINMHESCYFTAMPMWIVFVLKYIRLWRIHLLE